MSTGNLILLAFLVPFFFLFVLPVSVYLSTKLYVAGKFAGNVAIQRIQKKVRNAKNGEIEES